MGRDKATLPSPGELHHAGGAYGRHFGQRCAPKVFVMAARDKSASPLVPVLRDELPGWGRRRPVAGCGLRRPVSARVCLCGSTCPYLDSGIGCAPRGDRCRSGVALMAKPLPGRGVSTDQADRTTRWSVPAERKMSPGRRFDALRIVMAIPDHDQRHPAAGCTHRCSPDANTIPY